MKKGDHGDQAAPFYYLQHRTHTLVPVVGEATSMYVYVVTWRRDGPEIVWLPHYWGTGLAALLRDEVVTSDFDRTKVGRRANAGPRLTVPRGAERYKAGMQRGKGEKSERQGGDIDK